MKRNLLKSIIILLTLTFVTLQSCKKKEFADINNDSIKYLITNINIRTHNQDVTELIKNPNDKDDEKMNKYFYALAQSLEELVKEKRFIKDVIKYAKKRDDDAANLIDLLAENKEYAKAVSDKLSKKGLSFSDIKNDFTHNNGKYIEKYIPCIFIPNIKTLDANLQPILSPNIELNSDKNQNYENCIIAWYFTKEGEKKEIIINEEDAMNTKNPILIIANAEEKFQKNSNLIHTEITNNNSRTERFSTNEYRINYRYERSGKSEFAISAGRITSTGNAYNILKKDNGTYVSTKEIQSVDKNDIGKDLSHWEQFSDNFTPYSSNFIFYNTYERDWNNTDKSLGHAVSQNGGNLYLYGKRRYSSEWYAFDPSTLSNHEVNIEYIHNNWALWYTNYKTKLRIWKVL